MTHDQLKKYVPKSGRAIYMAKYNLAWGTRRRAGTQFEYAYPVKANPDAYEVVKITVAPKKKKAPAAAKAPATAPAAKAPETTEAPSSPAPTTEAPAGKADSADKAKATAK